MRKHETCWNDSPLGYLVAVALFVSAFVVLFPWGLSYSETIVNLSENQVMAPDAAREELTQLSARIEQPGFTPAVAHQVIKRAMYIERHTPWVPKELLAKTPEGDRFVLDMKRSAIFNIVGQIVQRARDKFRTDRIAGAELRSIAGADAEWNAMADFRPVTTSYDWGVIGDNFQSKLPFAFAFALLYFIAMIKARGLNLAVEIMNPLSLILATAAFPVSWLVYPYKDPDQQISKVVNAMGMAFSLLMSFGGVASAQTVKKGEGGKKKDPIFKLQTDSRVMIPLGDDPKESTLFNRSTLDFGKGVVENISLGSPSGAFWYSETCGGPWLGKVAKTAVLAVGCVAKAKGSEPGWVAGVQAYRPFGKRFFMAIPVARMEGKSFNFLGAVSVGVGRGWSLVPEMSFKLTPGKRPVRSGGIVLRRSFGRDSAEIGALRNGAGQLILRPRLIQNFAF